MTGVASVRVERRSVLGDGGGGNPLEGWMSSMTMFLNSADEEDEGEQALFELTEEKEEER